jgi:membrane associated rhomboid family serine protease
MTPTRRATVTGIGRDVQRAARLVAGLVAAIWLIDLLNWVFLGGALNAYGLQPRTRDGLPGIAIHPLLHASLGHLAANTVSLAIFGTLVAARNMRDFWIVTTLAVIVGGMGTWLIGHSGNHVGASGMVFGYLGYLLLIGWFERRFASMLLSLAVFGVYGRVLSGLSPLQHGISWELHLFGFLAGAATAWLSGNRPHGRRG